MTFYLGIFAIKNSVIMRIAILQYKSAVMSSIAGPYDMLGQVNEMVGSFRPDLPNPQINVDIVRANTIKTPSNYDLVIIPAMQFNKIKEVLIENKHILYWLINHHKKGGEIASICLGAFLLAATGLINNQYATTHWMGVDLFKKMYPEVKLVDDKFITDYNRIYTSGGAYSFTTLIIYLIEKFFGAEAAILISKIFLIHLHDSKQNSYKILNLQRNHANKAIIKVQDYIEQHTDQVLTVDKLASIANLTLRTFMRNFKKSTGDTPNAYIQKVRVEKAKKLLESGDMSIEQISFEVGYSDFASFRKIFKKSVGQTPSLYRKRYNRMFTHVNTNLELQPVL